MTAIATTAPPSSLRTPLFFSALLHILLFTSLIISTMLSRTGEVWGGPGDGGATRIGLVGNVPGISLPHPDVVTPNRNVDETKGLYKDEPKPKPPEPEPNTTKLPEFAKEKPQKVYSRPSKVLENPVQPPPNAVPYGAGGTPDMPYAHFSMGGGTAAGLGTTGPGGGGDFGSRYSWYVEAVRNRISSNWLISTIDPTVRIAPRAVISFQVLRDGSIANIQVTQSSGNRSVDDSGRRAILSSSPLPALPSDYRGSNINVEFWFDFHR